MMATGSVSILVYLLCLLMGLSPGGAGAVPADMPATEVVLKDTVLEINDATYELGLDARLAAVQDGDGFLMEFGIDGEAGAIFPGRMRVSQSEITAMLDGMSRSVKLSMDDVRAQMADGMGPEMGNMQAFVESYAELIAASVEMKDADTRLTQEQMDALFERGAPEQETVEYGDAKLDVDRYEYTIAKDDIANMIEALFTEYYPRLGAAMDNYMREVMALTGEEMPEGGFAQMFRELPMDMEIDCVERVNEAEGFSAADLVMRLEMDGEAVELPINVLSYNGSTTTRMEFAHEGQGAFTMVATEEQTDEGVYTTMDMHVSMADSGFAPYAEEITLEDEDASVSVIGGADGPTGVFITGAPNNLDLHAEVFDGAVDAQGKKDFHMNYDYALGGMVHMVVSCEGTQTEADGESALEANIRAQVDAGESGRFGLRTTLVSKTGGELQIAAPLDDAVDVLGGDSEQLEALGAELTKLSIQHSAKLMQSEGLSSLIADMTSMAVSGYTDYEYADTVEIPYDEEVPSDAYTDQFQGTTKSFGTLVAQFAYDFPVREEMNGYVFESGEFIDDAYVSLSYLNPTTGSPLDIHLMGGTAMPRYHMDETGAFVADEGDSFALYGDDEGGYWYADWYTGDVTVEIFFSEPVAREDISALIQAAKEAD